MPGKVIFRAGEPSRVVASEEEMEMLKVSGYREERIGSEIRMIPEVSRRALAALRFGQLPAVTGHDAKFQNFVRPGTTEWKEFFSTRKVVESETAEGQRRVEVTSNIADKLQPEEVVHEPLLQLNLKWAMAGSPSLADQPGAADEPKARRYELVNLLTDSFIKDKFAFPESFVNSIKYMAITDPHQAAAKAQAFIRRRPGSESAVVVAGKYARSKKWALDSVRIHATRFPETVAASDAVIIGKKMSVYAPTIPGEKAWFVVGPNRYIEAIMNVYKMVCSAGTASVMFSLGTELTVLDIDINNGDTFESPTVYLHAGSQEDLPVQSSPIAGSFLSADGRGRLNSYNNAVSTVELDGDSIASAVRISSRHVLVNSHVLREGAQLTVGGVPAFPVRMLSKDLWLVKSVVDYDVAWPLRDAEVGEAVVVCYKKGDELQYSSPLTIRNTDGQALVMSKAQDLQYGMSGGALVALSDMSLLGVYDGVGALTAMGSVFSQEAFTDICTMDRATSVDHKEAVDGEGSMFTRMKDRGLVKYLQAATESIRPLYTGDVHVGMGLCSGGKLVTTCDPDVGPLSMGRGAPPKTYDEVAKGRYATALDFQLARGPLLMRRPNYGEEVFVLGKDDEGPYFSNRKSRVVHVGVSAQNFVISTVDENGALPFVGGLVVAVTDAAVLGQYARHTVSDLLGEGGFCYTVRGSVVSQVSQLEPTAVLLDKMFPVLHPGSWDVHLVEEMFTHASVNHYSDNSPFNSGMTPLAQIGEAAIRVGATIKLRDAGVPVKQWSSLVSLALASSSLACRAEDLGLDAFVKVGPGVVLHKGSKVHAEALQALCGAVFLSETMEVFFEFLDAVGVFRLEDV